MAPTETRFAMLNQSELDAWFDLHHDSTAMTSKRILIVGDDVSLF